MLVKVLRKEKIGGMRLEPETIVDLPEAMVDTLARQGVVQILGQGMETNLGGLRISIGGGVSGISGEVLVKK